MGAPLLNNAILATLGIILSAYSVHVEHQVEHKNENPDGEEFQALCDIEAIGASCSAVFSLPEGKMLSFFGLVPEGHALDIPNGILGILFYSYILIRFFTGKHPRVLFATATNLLLSSLAIASSLFLGRKLYIIRELCVVCLSTHIINTTLWLRSIREGLDDSKKTVKVQ